MTRKVMKSVIDSISVLGLAAALSFMPKQANAGSPTKVSWGIGYRFGYGPITSVENVPLIVRDVPVHRDDLKSGYWTSIEPIADTNIKREGVAISIFPHLNFTKTEGNNELELKVGLDFKGYLNDAMNERNYTNYPGTSEHGRGAALTYYSLQDACTPSQMLMNAGIEARMKFPIKETAGIKTMLFTGYEINRTNMNLVNGWDRFNKNQAWQVYKIGDLYEHTLKIGVTFEKKGNDYRKMDRSIFIATSFYNDYRKGLGKEIKISHGTPVFIGFETDFR